MENKKDAVIDFYCEMQSATDGIKQIASDIEQNQLDENSIREEANDLIKRINGLAEGVDPTITPIVPLEMVETSSVNNILDEIYEWNTLPKNIRKSLFYPPQRLWLVV